MSDEGAQEAAEKYRPLLHIDEQLDHLVNKGVSFDLCSREAAAKYLHTGNNLFRAAAYRKLFPLQDQGKRAGEYLGLDFEHLRALSSLDRRLRQCFLSITVDVEHFARIKLLNACEDRGEDGYAVVEEFLSGKNHKLRNHVTGNMEGRSKKGEKFDEYSGDLIAHYLNKKMPIWVFSRLSNSVSLTPSIFSAPLDGRMRACAKSTTSYAAARRSGTLALTTAAS